MQFECVVESGEKKLLTFKAFTPWTKKDGDAKKGIDIDKLEVDKEYNISYSEFQTEQMDYPSKTAVVFFEAKKDKFPKASETVEVKPEPTITEEKFRSFGEAYKKKFPVNMRDYNHFMKTFFEAILYREGNSYVKHFERYGR